MRGGLALGIPSQATGASLAYPGKWKWRRLLLAAGVDACWCVPDSVLAESFRPVISVTRASIPMPASAPRTTIDCRPPRH